MLKKGFFLVVVLVFIVNVSANLILDPSFENASLWLISGGGGFSTGVSRTGSQSGYLEAGTYSRIFDDYYGDYVAGLSGNTDYDLSVYVTGTGGTGMGHGF